MNTNTLSELTFRFDSRMAFLLGEQSVSNNVAAIFELVKNGYDADATNVDVIFRGSRDSTKKLRIKSVEIRDNGVGMTYEDLRDKWMVVGTYAKERETKSPKFGRRVAGEKGIGRFATQRLGRRIILRTYPEDILGRKTEYPNKKIMLIVDWEKFKPGTTFDEVKNEVRILDAQEKDLSGVEISIEDLKDDWTEENIRDLNERVGWLVVPSELGRESHQSFDVRVMTEGFVLQRLEVKPALLRKAPYSIQAKLKEDTIQYKIFEKGDSKRDSRDIGQHPVQFEGTCGEAEFRLYFYPGDEPGEIRHSVYYRDVLGAGEFESRLEKFGGIKIYNDDIRILPYGNPGNDWLGLNKLYALRRGSSLRNERVIGFLIISRDRNPLIKETTTREGIIQNKAFEELQQFAIRCMRLLASYYQEVKERNIKSKKKNIPALISDETTELSSDLQPLPIPEDVKHDLIERMVKIARQVSQIEREHEKQLSGLEDEQHFYRRLASVGITSIAFAHEIVYPLATMELTIRNLMKELGTNKTSTDTVKQEISQISQNVSSLLHWTKYISSFGGLLTAPSKEEIILKAFVEETFKPFHAIVKDLGIEVKNAIPEYLPKLVVNRADLESIFVNLFTNSVRAMKNVKDRQKIILLSVHDNPGSLELHFSDTGIGVPVTEVERIFEPLYSTYRSQDGEFKGTGMGLTIIREILGLYGGKINVITPELAAGATFSLTIPWKSVRASDKQ